MAFQDNKWVGLSVAGLLITGTVLIVLTIHGESLTFDKEDHRHAGELSPMERKVL